jgi:hypothetical protein
MSELISEQAKRERAAAKAVNLETIAWLEGGR